MSIQLLKEYNQCRRKKVRYQKLNWQSRVNFVGALVKDIYTIAKKTVNSALSISNQCIAHRKLNEQPQLFFCWSLTNTEARKHSSTYVQTYEYAHMHWEKKRKLSNIHVKQETEITNWKQAIFISETVKWHMIIVWITGNVWSVNLNNLPSLPGTF